MRAKPSRNGKGIKSNNNSNKFSLKNPLQENVSSSNQIDNSVLRPPIDTSIAGLKQAVKLFETGTPEVVHLLTFECDVIYECRVCRNLFRSLANFISHKRLYCTRRFNHVQASSMVEDYTIMVEDGSGKFGPSLPSRITARQDLTAILQTSAAQYYKGVEDKLSSRDVTRSDSTIHLQPMENTTSGVYQTIGKKESNKLIKNQVSELNSIISKNEEVVLGPDGKVLREEGLPKSECRRLNEEFIVNSLICSLCKVKFSSKKTLSHHTKTVHESFRVCYTCPCCKNLFSNTWSVHRHLYKVHRKSNEQVRRLRAQIQKKQVNADRLAEKFNRKSDSAKFKKDNKSWVEHFEETSEHQRCGGCGRKFDRRAALTSHAQICQKRMAACNSLQTVKRKEEKSAETHNNDSVGITVQQPAQGSPVQKMPGEKRIGIQVRMNYCKNSAGNAGMETRRSERHKNCEAKDELHNFDDFGQSTEPVDILKSENFKNAKERMKDVSSCNSYKKNKANSKTKMKRLESMCTQLRKAVGLTLEDGENCSGPVMLNGIDNETHDSSSDHYNTANCDKSNKISSITNDDVINIVDDNLQKTEFNSTSVSTPKDCPLSSSTEVCDVNNVQNNSELGILNSNRMFSDLNDESNNSLRITSFFPSNGQKELMSGESVKSIQKNSDVITLNDDVQSIDDNCLPCFSETSDSETVKNSVGILTRFKVRSIFKSEFSTAADSISSDNSDQEELNIGDESSVKENLSETHCDDQDQWIQKKLSQFVRYKNKQCIICLKTFKKIPPLKLHVADHLGLNNYHCLFTDCTYVIFSKSDCLKHVLKMHLKPDEKQRASTFVGDLGLIKSDNCDNDVKCDLINLSKRKKSESENSSLQISVLKDSVDSKLHSINKDGLAVLPIGNDSREVVEDSILTSKIDSSTFSELSDNEPKVRRKYKKRKISELDKKTIPVRKCSPISTTDIIAKNLMTVEVGAQFKDDDLSIDKDDVNNFTTLCTKKTNVVMNNQRTGQKFSDNSGDSDFLLGKGRDTEEEDEIQDVPLENGMDDGNLRRMVMEVIFGGQETEKLDKNHIRDKNECSMNNTS